MNNMIIIFNKIEKYNLTKFMKKHKTIHLKYKYNGWKKKTTIYI